MACFKIRHGATIGVASDHLEVFRQACRSHTSKVPQAVNTDTQVQGRLSSSDGFDCKYRKVRTIPCWMLSFAVQPAARILEQSRKMKGLSPIQPRFPPEYLICGSKPSSCEIHPMELFTEQYSSVPRLKMFTLAEAFSMANKMASTQSWMYKYDF